MVWVEMIVVVVAIVVEDVVVPLVVEVEVLAVLVFIKESNINKLFAGSVCSVSTMGSHSHEPTLALPGAQLSRSRFHPMGNHSPWPIVIWWGGPFRPLQYMCAHSIGSHSTGPTAAGRSGLPRPPP